MLNSHGLSSLAAWEYALPGMLHWRRLSLQALHNQLWLGLWSLLDISLEASFVCLPSLCPTIKSLQEHALF
jgi:hypothetical protein